jgi:polyphosphate kinase 2 (PPK2 family)
MKERHGIDQLEMQVKGAASKSLKQAGDLPSSASAPADARTLRLGKDCDYERELRRLQVELVKLQEWIRQEKLRVVVLFEGRDAAGKGGAIKRIT